MTRPLAEVEQELDDTRERVKLLNARVRELMSERDRAKVAQAEPHPWTGRKVKRWVKAYRFSDKRTQRGVVVQAGATIPYGPKGHRPEPGECYVQSPSGHTRYPFASGGGYSGPWELDA